MKHKVSELSGALLDAAAAKSEGAVSSPCGTFWDFPCPPGPLKFVSINKALWRPHKDAAQAVPIMERERIVVDTWADADDWTATVMNSTKCAGHPTDDGPTLLVAAMRAFVRSRFGDEVEL